MVGDLEREMITGALELASGHLGNVCIWLGISRVTLRKKMADHELQYF
ncbi:MAG: helix-turn-helix domain-containing protein [Verrucomicrobiales bacterium]